MDDQDSTAFDKRRYQEGQDAAKRWVAAGGDLMANPPESDEAYENGFADFLAETRRVREEYEKC